MKKRTKNIQLIGAAITFVGFGCCGSVFFALRPSSGIGVTIHDVPRQIDLPSNASNISYGIVGLGLVFDVEFDLSEADFRAWCTQEGWQPHQQSDVEFTRHPAISAALPTPGQFAYIRDALVVRHTFPQGDTGYTIVFDRQSDRVYYNYIGR